MIKSINKMIQDQKSIIISYKMAPCMAASVCSSLVLLLFLFVCPVLSNFFLSALLRTKNNAVESRPIFNAVFLLMDRFTSPLQVHKNKQLEHLLTGCL